MNLYNVLSNRYVGMSNFERLFAQKFGGMGGKIKELEGIPPLTFTANGQPLLDYHIYGNTVDGESVGVQTESGEPTGYKLPMVSRGENLWDDNWFNKNVSDNSPSYVPLYVGEGQFTCYTTCPRMNSYSDSSASRFIFFLRGRVNTGAQNTENGVWINHPRTVTSSEGYVTLCYRKMEMYDVRPWEYKTMIVESSTAPDRYVPYYREETPIYIGDTKLMQDEYVSYAEQKVYKRTSNLFTPSEDKGYYQGNRFIADDDYLCTPYIPLDDPEYWVKMDFDTANAPIGGKYGVEWFVDYNRPVYGECIDIVFHGGVLYDGRYEVDPESMVVYTPKYVRAFVHKDCTKVNLSIGSDREHSEYAPYLVPQDPPVPLPALPTTEGSTTLDIDTTIKPSNVYIKYHT